MNAKNLFVIIGIFSFFRYSAMFACVFSLNAYWMCLMVITIWIHERKSETHKYHAPFLLWQNFIAPFAAFAVFANFFFIQIHSNDFKMYFTFNTLIFDFDSIASRFYQNDAEFNLTSTRKAVVTAVCLVLDFVIDDFEIWKRIVCTMNDIIDKCSRLI